MALEEGLNTTWLQHMQLMVIVGDSKVLLECLNGRAVTQWCSSSVIQNIRWLHIFHACYFQHVYREANFVADK